MAQPVNIRLVDPAAKVLGIFFTVAALGSLVGLGFAFSSDGTLAQGLLLGFWSLLFTLLALGNLRTAHDCVRVLPDGLERVGGSEFRSHRGEIESLSLADSPTRLRIRLAPDQRRASSVRPAISWSRWFSGTGDNRTIALGVTDDPESLAAALALATDW